MKNKKAFTMAETMLTLTIIGVVMALMLRAINRVNPDKNRVIFLKSYHAIETVVSDAINDGTKYDQTNDAVSDFSTTPLATAEVLNGTVCTSSGSCSSKKLTKESALCYYAVDQLNIIGGYNCDNNNSMNFRASNGACFWDMYGSSYPKSVIIDPTCSESKSNGYVITVQKDGKMTVPSSSSSVDDQATAYKWIQDQTQIK